MIMFQLWRGSMIVVVLAFAAYAEAGARGVGNGGDAVVCTDKRGRKTAMLLDYYEAAALRGIQIDLGPAHLSVGQKIQLALDRLREISPVRAERYHAFAANFLNPNSKDVKFLAGHVLQDIPDSKHISIPNNCGIEQVVVQKTVLVFGEPKFLVNKDIWDLFDNDSRAGMTLHEAIYEEALSKDAKDSIGTRYVNSKISSSLKEYNTSQAIDCFFDRTGLNERDRDYMESDNCSKVEEEK